MTLKPRILAADDDQALCYLLTEQLGEAGYEIDAVTTGASAMEHLGQKQYDLLLLDLKMRPTSGEEVLRKAKDLYPQLPVIILTGDMDISKAVECIKIGAYDFITKPYNVENLFVAVRRALEHKELLIKNELLSKRTHSDIPLRIIGESQALKNVINLALKAARSDSNILIEGETGTGKELMAEFIHQNSARSKKPFVVINCASLPDTLFESELFGFEKGSFTDAKHTKPGLVEIANGGSLFLDEVGETSINLQPKLLRFLENGEYRRVGGLNALRSDVRVVGATNRNLMEETDQKNFRKDLLFRLNVITLVIPPLRDRAEDIPILANHFLLAKSPVRTPKTLSEDAKKILMSYDFPGNIRELEHIIERAIIFSDGPVIRRDNLYLPAVKSVIKESTVKSFVNGDFSAGLSLDEVEKQHIKKVLNQFNWDRVRTSLHLGISQKTLYTKIKKYQLEK
ncbi:MAG: sigma-54-dependent Fis family transcriptional regulator [Ignavibacteriaceae bacterium]|nr:sigma-54-dependent Fis family transcriptional regulator [Ignavibacteriaceae bacterium]